jgi:hypothetical protein
MRWHACILLTVAAIANSASLPVSGRACRFGTVGNSVGETPGRVQIARFWCGRLARL